MRDIGTRLAAGLASIVARGGEILRSDARRKSHSLTLKKS
jgi:hypothetical protein